ncbi:MAG TPA: hydroxymethylpyrimidine/phosphomethylpyrimidine kinase [Burkholderiaceae bacterium]|nr:hydroxymethylpyrimidine/phosphomethylpyrimidine kinase [Burkholderiaceae bacterium]
MNAPLHSESPPLVLAFAVSDPTSGSGLQADLLTFASMGCHGLTVVTGLTVQDSAGIDDMLAMDADWVEDQARSLLEDMQVAAFKIGVVSSVENVQVIAEILSDYPDIPVIFDPVLASARGESLADDETIDAMRELLLPHTTLLTPNSLEVRRLAADEDDETAEIDVSATRLIELGAKFVLVTGTHEHSPEVVNLLYSEAGLVRSDSWTRLAGTYHGAGGTLAAACTALIANGLDVPEAVREAQEYTWQALAAGFRPGMGHWLPDRFFWARESGEEHDLTRPPGPGALLTPHRG